MNSALLESGPLSRRRFLQLALAANAAILSVACAGPDGSTQQAAPARKQLSLQKLKIFYQLPTEPSAVSELAAFKMMKDVYGVEVEIIQTAGSDAAVTSVIAGQVDLASSGLGAAIIAAGQGQEIQAVVPGPYQSSYQMVVRNDVEGWQGLVGRPVGMTATNDPSYYTAALQLHKHGVDPASINWLTVRGTPARAAALQAGKIDGAELSATAALEVLKDPGFKKLDAFGKDFPTFIFGGYYGRKALIRDHPDVLQAFATASLAQYRAMNTKDTFMVAARELIPDHFNEAHFSEAYDILKEMNVYDPDKKIWSKPHGDTTSQLLADYGVIERFVPFDQWATSQFIDAARQELGALES